MKVILKEPISTLGALGDVVNVADGYARNYLIPKGFALKATSANMNQFEAEKSALLAKLDKIKGEAEDLRAKLEAIKLEFARKAAEAAPTKKAQEAAEAPEAKEAAEATEAPEAVEATEAETPQAAEKTAEVEAGHEKLFGSVTSLDIEAALKSQGFAIDRKDIILSEPIKRLGTTTIGVKLHSDVRAEIEVSVVRE